MLLKAKGVDLEASASIVVRAEEIDECEDEVAVVTNMV
jgi:hypothetical protein